MLRLTNYTSLLLFLLLLPVARSLAQTQRPASAPAPASVARAAGEIQVKVSGFRSARGQVFVALWRSGKSFPGTPPKGSLAATVKIVKGVAEATFRRVPPGMFAVTVFHDEDGDTELDTNWIGIPREGVGFSRDARGRYGPPSWDDAKLVLEPGEVEQVKITMLYF